MLGDWTNNLTYVTMLQFWKKLIKLLKIALLGPYFGKNWATMGYAQNQAISSWNCCRTNNFFAQENNLVLSGSIWANTALGNFLCNIALWVADNLYKENKKYNCSGPLSIQIVV